ncbi:Spo0E like sporulation regulatory protein [Desulfitobacterium dichloroeliminans LMG P-21439]|uniref:Spo0E like sporulation regulatory protein n=1 Tax=Desulfitobacterium dichloroeliminans (strain LMG P-21439 / DCA1) TaxID=871963 RepID=L0F348_DESDL|nr:aspartyl-phosphate phosphatase Spo0E family protein [Desulfitobacterium dichloroeliminans]AGA67592.1 Spo0E like sporulation regulatory protein [Desulfitobacterium dichloroeliminans LMG P-21439]
MEERLLRKIEALRKVLYQNGTTYCLTDARVVAMSQELDRLLNEYQRIVTNKQMSFW